MDNLVGIQMAHSTRGSWHLIIEQWRHEFSKRNYPIPTTVVNEKTFRNEFQDLCKSQKEYFYTSLLTKLHFATVSKLARAVDTTFEYVPPFSLTALVFGATFVSVQHGSFTGVAELLGRLNKAIPSVFTEIDRCPEDSDLQAILQQTINIYMGYIFTVIDCFRPDSMSLSLDSKTSIEMKAKDVETNIKALAARFEQLLDRRSSNSWSFGSNPSTNTQHSYHSQPPFTFVRILGRGSFGEVHEVREPTTGDVYAMKIIPLDNRSYDSDKLEHNVRAEFDTMKKLTHIHIVKVLICQKKDNNFTILMSPVADLDLRSYLEMCVKDNYPQQAVSSILSWFGCLLQALAFAHRCSVIHQDVKPSNILVKGEGGQLQVYLADFGMAKDFSDRSTSATINGAVCGTPVYRAPEVRPHQSRGRMADMFSLGCVFSEMLTVCSRRSLDEYQEHRRARDKDENQLAFRYNLPKVSSWLKNLSTTQDENEEAMSLLVRQMMREDPDKRPTASKVIQSLRNTERPDELFCAHCV